MRQKPGANAGDHPALAGFFLPWVPVEAGIYRLNKVMEREGLGDVECSPSWERDTDLPETFVDYDQTPREYFLNAVTTVLDVQTRVSDLYNQPYDQIQEQLRLLIEKVKERQESELLYNADYGLLSNAAPFMKIPTRRAPPTRAGVFPCASARHRRLRP
jgi:Phage capsid-like protein